MTILAFREIGKGHSGIETFCGCMNMPLPLTELTYNNTIKSTMHPTYVVTRKDMVNAARDLSKLTLDDFAEDQVCDTVASFDGTWQ